MSGSRGRLFRLGLTAVFLSAVLPFSDAAESAEAAKIVVGPNMLASRDGDFPHVELVVAASPKNAKNLVGGAITYTRPEGGTANRAYATLDGGASWKASDFPEQLQWGSGDPYTAFTPQGTAIFSGLAFIKDDVGRTRAGLYVYRSEDGGLTWGKGADLGYSYDHEQITVDHTTGKYAGRIYIGVLYGPYPQYVVGIFRSEDDGKTWTGPVEAANGGGKIGINDVMPMVLSDGTLVVPYGDFEFLPDKSQADRQGLEHVVVRPLVRRRRHVPARRGRCRRRGYDFDDKTGKQLGGFPSFAADARFEGVPGPHLRRVGGLASGPQPHPLFALRGPRPPLVRADDRSTRALRRRPTSTSPSSPSTRTASSGHLVRHARHAGRLAATTSTSPRRSTAARRSSPPVAHLFGAVAAERRAAT